MKFVSQERRNRRTIFGFHVTWIASSLTHSGFPIHRVIKIGAAWNRYYGERTDATNETLQELRDRVVEAVVAARHESDTHKLLNKIIATVGEDESYGPDYIIAIALMEQVASDHPKLKAADSQSANEAK